MLQSFVSLSDWSTNAHKSSQMKRDRIGQWNSIVSVIGQDKKPCLPLHVIGQRNSSVAGIGQDKKPCL